MKILIIGCGSIGERHLRNLKALGVKDILVCDAHKNRLRDIAKKYGIRSLYYNHKKALENKVDAALIATPPHTHVSIALDAIDKGAHVFIEKPISHTLVNLDKLIKKSQSKKRIVLVGYNLRFHQGLRLVKGMLAQGKIGNILCVRAEFGQYLPFWRPWQDYRQSYTAREASGGGIILDASHEIDYLRWLLGRIKSVNCLAVKVSKLEVDTEDCAEILLEFEKGVAAEIHLDFIRQDYTRNAEFIGEKGTIIWDYAGNSVKVYSAARKKWQSFAIKSDANEMYLQELRHFLKCILKKEKALIDAQEASQTLKIALMAKKSARSGRKINL